MSNILDMEKPSNITLLTHTVAEVVHGCYTGLFDSFSMIIWAMFAYGDKNEESFVELCHSIGLNNNMTSEQFQTSDDTDKKISDHIRELIEQYELTRKQTVVNLLDGVAVQAACAYNSTDNKHDYKEDLRQIFFSITYIMKELGSKYRGFPNIDK